MNDNHNNDDSPQDAIRIGDAERNEAVRLLGEHYEAGRLSQEEHSERVDTALRGTTRKDLDALFTDLPHDAADQGWQGPRQAGQPTGPQQDGPGWQGWFAGPGQQGGQQGRPGGGYRSGAPFAGPTWARRWGGPRGPFGLPIPLIAILAVAVIAGIACTVAGGHPPVLLFLALGAAAFAIVRRRRFGYRG